jgi:hypothetical protein
LEATGSFEEDRGRHIKFHTNTLFFAQSVLLSFVKFCRVGSEAVAASHGVGQISIEQVAMYKVASARVQMVVNHGIGRITAWVDHRRCHIALSRNRL